MQSNENIEELRRKLPLGAMKLIAERTGLAQKTVKNFFCKHTEPRIDTYNTIMNETINLLREMKKKEIDLKDLLS